MAKKILFIVESPAKAKKISKFLGKDYIVEATIGHVADLSTGGKNNLGIDTKNNFKPKYVILPDKKDRIKVLIKLASTVDLILLAADPDREGEAIAWHLAELLDKTKKKIKRITFYQVTKAAVLNSMKNARDLDPHLYDAQQARRVVDRIVGFSVSPFLIKKFGPKMSAGRVQSVAVRMVVDREREIEKFVPKEYWSITAALAKKGSKDGFVAKYMNRVTDSKTAKKVKTDLDTDSFVIKDIKQQEQKQKPNPPFITSSLAGAGAGKYRFSAAKTMKAAQSLYEAGMITYIRSDSVRCDPESIDFCRQWLTENNHDIPQKPNSYITKKTAQDAHEAIRPTDIELTPKNVYLSNDEQKIYTLIWERFVASQMMPAIYDNTAVIVESSSGHQLKVNGKVLKYKGWLDIMDDLGNKKDRSVVLPDLANNDNVQLISPKVKSDKKATKPPSRFTEQKLIEELEKKGIGRPSTYAAIMSKITTRNYVERKANLFIATDRGKEVIDSLIEFFDFMEYKYTADMESQLDKIAENKLTYVDMLNKFYIPFKKQLKKAYNSENKDYGFRCDKCKDDSPMYLRNGKYGFYLSCANFPACKYSISCEVIDDKPVIKKRGIKIIDDVRCPVCKSGMVLNAGGKFGPFYYCSEYPICKGKRKVPYGKKCPKCNNELYATIYHGDSVLFCMGYPDCNYSEKLKEKISDPKKLVKSSTMPKRVRRALK